jgi:hypothetical protein
MAIDTYTKLLLHADGTDGSTLILNEAPAENVDGNATPNGSACTKTAVKKFGTASAYFNGSTDYITVPIGGFFGNRNFTVDCWINFPSTSAYAPIYESRDGDNYGLMLGLNAGGGADKRLYVRYAGTNYSGDTVLLVNTWYHVALVGEGTMLKVYLNGVLEISQTISYNLPTARIIIGRANDSSLWYKGYIDEIRVSYGARWTSNFTPPNFAHTIDDNTKVLMHMDGVDNGTSFPYEARENLSVSANGNTCLKTNIKKFGTASVLLDGAGDFLTFPPFPATLMDSGDFTIDTWVYLNALPTGNTYNTCFYLLSNGPNNANPGTDFFLGSSIIRFNIADYTVITVQGNWTPEVNKWYHIALVRNGNTFYLFLDGVQIGTATISTAMPTWSNTWAIGRCEATGENTGYFNGYIDEYRISKGIARWTSNFTPPITAYGEEMSSVGKKRRFAQII